MGPGSAVVLFCFWRRNNDRQVPVVVSVEAAKRVDAEEVAEYDEAL